jgi:hypothetical protein
LACDAEGEDPLDEAALRDAEQDDADATDPDCEIVPHMFHDWTLAEGVHGVTIEQVTFPACGEAIEFELRVVVGDVPVAQPVDAAEPLGGPLDAPLGPNAANGYWLAYAGQNVYLGNGPLTWSTRFTLTPYQSWAVLVALVEVPASNDAQQIAGVWFAFAPPLLGGGQYRGPGDVVPGWQNRPPWSPPRTPGWQIPPGAAQRQVCSGRAPSICVSGVFWDAAAQIAQTQGFCAAARSEHGLMSSYVVGRSWPGYPAPSCMRTTGFTNDMWSTVRTRCTNPPAAVGCRSFSPMISPYELIDLTTDVLSTNNLWEGCRRELDANLGC